MTGHAFLDADYCGRICLVLFHSLWQMGLAAMLAWLLGRKMRKGSVQWAYWGHVAALVLGLAAMPATLWLLIDRAPGIPTAVAATEAAANQTGVLHSVSLAGNPGSGIVFNSSNDGQTLVLNTFGAGTTSQVMWKNLAPWIVCIYAFGAAMMFVRLGIGIARTERMRRRATPITTGVAAAAIAKVAKTWRLRGVPIVAQAERIVVPTVIGLLRPMILVPASALTALTASELELILAHELAHVRRFDMWVNLLQRLGEVVLFFNPAMWYLSRRISALREYCCDDVVCRRSELEAGGVPVAYASALLRVVELAQPARLSGVNMATLAADGDSPSELRRRVASLLGEPMNEPLRLSRGGLLAAIGVAAIVVAALGSIQSRATAADAKADDVDAVKAAGDVLKKAKESKQEMLKLPVCVVDADGKPVAGAKVFPWALRSSQGHGWWSEDDKESGVGPQEVVTDVSGLAMVLYPKYRYLKEQIKTLEVTLRVDEPDYAYVDDEYVEVPLEKKGPYEVKLKPAVRLTVQAMMDGKPASLDNVYAMWSDGRAWLPGAKPEKTADGKLKFPGMPVGKNSLLLVKLNGDRATHFSKITDFELKAGEPKELEVALEPSVQIHGKVSDNVPRPIREGFIKTWSLELPRGEDDPRRVIWFSWNPVKPDGTFTIDGWPAEERVEIIALCDGYMAKSGKAPDVVKNPPDPEHDPFYRAQVFAPNTKEPIEVEMTKMGRCVVTAVDDGGAPVAGVKIVTCPNVQWWNAGSQIYCWPLATSEKRMRERDYVKTIDKVYTAPFEGETDAKGKVTLDLPVGREDLEVISDVYELPVFLGRREVRINLTADKTSEVTLNLQAVGTERLGDWDKLAGVVFGCSTREGRQICALPEVRKKMDEFEARFRDGKSQHDPQLLSEAYTMVADAFVGVGDKEEAAKWRAKAAEEAAKVIGAGAKEGAK
jgi:beta-lactamase regulating signal transducer with metallopeptidase domain